MSAVLTLICWFLATAGTSTPKPAGGQACSTGSLPMSPMMRRRSPQVLATSLYEDPPAGLHEDASARLPEHPAPPRLLDLAPTLAAVQWAATGLPLSATRRAPSPSQRATGFSGHCTAGQLPNADSARPAIPPDEPCTPAQNAQFWLMLQVAYLICR